MTTHELNKQIEAFIADKDGKKESYSKEEIAFINQYEGSGGQGKNGATGEAVLYEFFTPRYIIEIMWRLAYYHGFDNTGTVLEPSLGTGRFLEFAPLNSNCYGFEINPISKRIAEINFPKAHIYQDYFETAFLEQPRFTTLIKKGVTWLDGYPFSLVIGNPPYGKYKNKYSSYFQNPKFHQLELFFIYQGIRLLKQGGLLVYITSSSFLRNGITYNSDKENLSKIADLVDAYRLPPVFKSSKVPTDILVFKRK